MFVLWCFAAHNVIHNTRRKLSFINSIILLHCFIFNTITDRNKCIFRQIILILNAKMISVNVYCEPVCDPLLAQTQMNGTAVWSFIMRHLHGNPNHLHMIKMSLVTAHHAKWALSVTSHTKKSNWAVIVCEIRDMVVCKHNGVNTHIFPLNKTCLCETFIRYKTPASLDYRVLSSLLLCIIK